MTSPEMPPGPPVSAQGLGVVPLLLSSPSEAFRRLGADPKWLGPFVAFVVLIVAAAWLRMELDVTYQADIAARAMERMGMPADDIDEALAAMPDPDALDGGYAAMHLAQALGGVVVVGFLGALVYWGLARLLGTTARFGRAQAAYWTANLPAALGYFLLAVVARAAGTVEVSVGPAALIPGIEWGTAPQILLDVLSPFSLLTLWFLAMASRFVLALNSSVAWTVAGVFWGVSTLLGVAAELFGAWLGGRL